MTPHRVFILFLSLVGVIAVVAIALHGLDFYLTPVHLRPFRADYESLKTSGNYSHGLGIIGASMIVIGVATYSSRKRIRALWKSGRLSVWLEFHIFLCLLGPILVIFHSTFKAGGVAAISLWTMLSVWASGMVGRFLYGQIPRNLQGAELSASQIDSELSRLGMALASIPMGSNLIKSIDESFASVKSPETLIQVLSTIVRLRSIRRSVHARVRALIALGNLNSSQAREIYALSGARAALLQKSVVLNQVGRLFHYWHVVHLPFSIIMFITLAAHVVVVVMLGYTWIF